MTDTEKLEATVAKLIEMDRLARELIAERDEEIRSLRYGQDQAGMSEEAAHATVEATTTKLIAVEQAAQELIAAWSEHTCGSISVDKRTIAAVTALEALIGKAGG